MLRSPRGSGAAQLAQHPLPQPGDDPLDQPGDMHLGAAEPFPDLRLGGLLHEPQMDDLPVPLAQLRHQRRQRVEVLHQAQPLLLHPDEVGEHRLAVLRAVTGERGVQRGGVVAVGGELPLQHLLLGEVHQGGQLGDRRIPVQAAGQLLPRLGQLHPQLLEPPRDMHRPGGVAEEPLDLTDDVRQREGGELHLAGQLEPVDGLDQPDHAGLDDVLHVVAAAPETAGREPHQRHVHLDQGVARVLVLVGPLLQLGQPAEELAGQLTRVPRGHGRGVCDAGQCPRVRPVLLGPLDDHCLRPHAGGIHYLSHESHGSTSALFGLCVRSLRCCVLGVYPGSGRSFLPVGSLTARVPPVTPCMLTSDGTGWKPPFRSGPHG
ncbi:protein of unknown function [Streptomyces murinus]